MSFFKKMGITSKVISVITIVALISCIIGGYVVSNIISKHIEKSSIENLIGEAKNINSYIERLDSSMIEELDVFFNMFAKKFTNDWIVEKDTYRLSNFTIPLLTNNGKLINGENHSIVNKFKKEVKFAYSTIFVKGLNGNLIRVSTSIKDENGKPLIGTHIDKDGIIYNTLLKGKSYSGVSRLLGKTYYAKYEPILKKGEIIGVLFVGINIENHLKKLESYISSRKIGETGYVFVLDKNEKHNGRFIFHPNMKGENLGKINNYSRKLLSIFNNQAKEGKEFRYEWSTNNVVVKKLSSFVHNNELNWIIASTIDEAQIYRSVWSIKKYVLLIFFGINLSIVLITFVFVKGIISPIRTASIYVESLSKGDLSIDNLNEDRLDELGVLIKGLNKLKDSFTSSIRDVIKTSNEVLESSSELSSSCNNLRKQAEEQNHSLDTVASSTEEMSVTTEEVSTNSSGTYELAKESKIVVSSGLDIVEKTKTNVEMIQQDVEVSVNQVDNLNKESREIESIVDIISKIADQTNLLALNAMIESARAGEHGKGFAVVAEEVKNLAGKTSKATENIESKIGSMRRNVEETSSTIEDWSLKTRAIKDSIEEISTIFNQINTKVEDTEIGTSGTSTAVTQQAVAIDEIARSIQEVSSISEENVLIVNGVSDLSSEMEKNVLVLKEKINFYKI